MFGLLISVGLLAAGLSGATIQFSVEDTQPGAGILGLMSFRLTYTVHDLTFLTNQELDIRFDPSVYKGIANGAAPPGFDVLLIQPDNPPGTFGDFSALALVPNPPLGTFIVDVFSVARPSGQSFSINQLDEDGTLLNTITSGVTVSAVPEPSTVLLFLPGGSFLIFRYRFKKRFKKHK